MKYFKYLVGALLLYLVLSNTNLDKVIELFREANYILLALNLPVFILSMFINSYKWQILVKTIDYFTLLRSNLISAYYTIFMPGQVASEGLKIYRLKDHDGNSLAHITSSVFVDKLIGLMSLMFIGAIGIIFSDHFDELKTLLLGFVLVIIAVLVVMVNSTLPLKLFRFIFNKSITSRFNFLKNLDGFLENCHDSLEDIIHGNYWLIFKAFLLGVVFQFLNILGNYIVAVGINLDVSFFDWIWVISLMSVALVLPITIGGIGVRELGFVGIFKFLGLASESAIALALASYGMMIYHALSGYFVDLIWGVKDKG